MKRVLAFIFTAVFSLPGFSKPMEDRQAKLNQFLSAQNYDELLYRLFPQVSQGRFPPLMAEEDKEDISWLRTQAENGHVPLMYFLSWKLMDTTSDESRLWNARARTGIMLGQKDCARDPRNPWYMIFEGRLVANNMTVRENGRLWYLAVDQALHWHQQEKNKKTMEWYCGTNNLLPANVAIEGRNSYWKIIKDHNDKNLSQTNKL